MIKLGKNLEITSHHPGLQPGSDNPITNKTLTLKIFLMRFLEEWEPILIVNVNDSNNEKVRGENITGIETIKTIEGETKMMIH